MKLSEIALRRFENRVRVEHYLAWANAELESGCNAPAVAELASYSFDADSDPKAVEFTFQECLRQLQISLPTDWHVALLDHARTICRDVEAGDTSPTDALALFEGWLDDLGEPHILRIWTDLWADLHHKRHPDEKHVFFNLELLAGENDDDAIRRVARQFMVLCDIGLPDRFPLVWLCTGCGQVSGDETWTAEQEFACPVCTLHSMRNMRYFGNRQALIGLA